jgi:malonyl-CoA O-methyltransferase
MFSTLGPDTLKELRGAAGADRVHRFIDMHDLGDMLLAAGLSAPVMDMEMVGLAYPDADTLLSDLRASGQTSARADRPRGLAGKGFAARLRRALGDKPKATFEVVYGHAWKAEEVKTVRIFRSIP